VRWHVRIASGARSLVLAHAERAYPSECCGALLGRASTETGGTTILRAAPLRNEAADHADRRFVIGSAATRAAERDAGRDGLEVVGFYHSHPDHPAEPSPSDVSQAWPWYAYVIVGVHAGEAGPARAWRLRDDRTSFDEAALVPFADAP
jgi:proteasome lid subunit RPN8/RPN11